MTAEAVLECRDAAFGVEGVRLIQQVNLRIGRGELAYIIGKTGSGKSTFLRTLYGAQPLMGGHAEVVGFDLSRLSNRQKPRLRRRLGIVFQDFQLLPDRSIDQNLRFVLQATDWRNPSLMDKRIREVLEQVGLLALRHKFPYQLSGGEQQRVAIARALLNQPPLILADEPTGNLDPATSHEVMKELVRCTNEGIAVVVVTHNYSLIRHFPGRIFEIESGTLRPRTIEELEL